jgi:hypothetical protein
MKLIKLAAVSFFVLASCGTQIVSEKPEPESLDWFIDDELTNDDRISHFQKYCEPEPPDTTGMNESSRGQLLWGWRRDRWKCAKRKHNEKLRYWIAYVEGQNSVANASEDWLTNWQRSYQDGIRSIDTNVITRRSGVSNSSNTCKSWVYDGGYTDTFGSISCY